MTLILLFSGTILGVAQLCNKKTGPCFSTFDEDVYWGRRSRAAFGLVSLSKHLSLNTVRP